jgi:hypothetical protein
VPAVGEAVARIANCILGKAWSGIALRTTSGSHGVRVPYWRWRQAAQDLRKLRVEVRFLSLPAHS